MKTNISKDVPFEERLRFDIAKRKSKLLELNNFLSEHKKHLPSYKLNKTFDHLIKDADKRKDTQKRINEEKVKIDLKNIKHKRKLTHSEINNIYQRQIAFLKNRDDNLDRMRKQKELKEETILKDLKIQKEKIGTYVEVVNRMNDDIKRRRDKSLEIMKRNKEKENIEVI